jgi:hypothetical protein
MKTGFTPGPWEHDFASGIRDGHAALIEYFVRRYGDDVAIAADIVNPDTGTPSEANARLIAAAPELLEALEAFVAWHSNPAMPHNDIVEITEKARAAIAKARGQ